MGSENEESKKRVQPVEISFLSGFFGHEASFLFLSADPVPLSCSLLWKQCGVFCELSSSRVYSAYASCPCSGPERIAGWGHGERDVTVFSSVNSTGVVVLDC